MSEDNKRPYGLRIIRNAMVPLTDDEGKRRGFGPYEPVLDACSLCPARCCRFTVKVGLPDAIHFCTTLQVPFFAGLTIVKGGGDRSFEVEYDARVCVGVEEEDWPGRGEIALVRREDGGCSHLVGIGGYQRCGVYAARPSTCRLYPVTWDSDVAQGGPAIVACPVPYGIPPAAEDEFYREASRSIERWQIHDRVLAQWHELEPEGGRTVEAFLGFAIPRTAELLNVDASIVLDPGGPNERLHQAMVDSGVVRY